MFKSKVHSKLYSRVTIIIHTQNLCNIMRTHPLWTDLVKMFSRKLRHASSFPFQRTDFKNVIFENIHWAHSEDAEVKRPRNPK